MSNQRSSVMPLLTLLTIIFIFSEFIFIAVKFYVMGLNAVMYQKLQPFIQQYPIKWEFIYPIFQYVCAQIFIYVFFIFLLGCIVSTISNFFFLRKDTARLLAIGAWLTFITAILMANSSFCYHSFFADLIPFNFILFSVTSILCFLAIALTVLLMLNDISNGRNCFKNVFIFLAIGVVFIFVYKDGFLAPTKNLSVATSKKPNIFIIGFDALRPDFLGNANNYGVDTPNFNEFIQASNVFTNVYTPAARTFSSWVTILTGLYPLHSGAREDNINSSTLQLDDTLPKRLKAAGYHTVYISDDNRFNNINHQKFGFEQSYGPTGNISDFIINLCNDFPMSNLLIATRLGRLFFTGNYANHASAHTYNPDSFMQQLQNDLNKLDDQPLFLAAHFNITAWPFYYFNDGVESTGDLANYKAVIQSADKQLGGFIKMLKNRGLLENAVFVLLSDHGVTFGLPGDRLTDADNYQGKDSGMKQLTYYAYDKVIFAHQNELTDYNKSEVKLILIKKSALISHLPAANLGLLGVDTSWGYGNDILSLKQNHVLLAIRSYHGSLGQPQQINEHGTLMDIKPTVLDILNLDKPNAGDGVSLQPLFFAGSLADSNRPLFLESCYSNAEFIKQDTLTANQIGKGINFFDIDPGNGLVYFSEAAIPKILATKQRGILWQDWLLAYYPQIHRMQMMLDINKKSIFLPVTMPSYVVLVNLKTGSWTTDLKSQLAKAAPLAALQSKLNSFYGSEMLDYQDHIVH
jgi:arylsulfatase A-like enzyme